MTQHLTTERVSRPRFRTTMGLRTGQLAIAVVGIAAVIVAQGLLGGTALLGARALLVLCTASALVLSPEGRGIDRWAGAGVRFTAGSIGRTLRPSRGQVEPWSTSLEPGGLCVVATGEVTCVVLQVSSADAVLKDPETQRRRLEVLAAAIGLVGDDHHGGIGVRLLGLRHQPEPMTTPTLATAAWLEATTATSASLLVLDQAAGRNDEGGRGRLLDVARSVSTTLAEGGYHVAAPSNDVLADLEARDQRAMGGSEAWGEVRSAQQCWRTGWIRRWPEQGIDLGMLGPLLLSALELRVCLSICIPRERDAQRSVERRQVAALADHQMVASTGFRVSARRRRASEELDHLEAALVSGGGLAQLRGFITVAARDHEGLARSWAELNHLASRIGLEVEACVGDQRQALRATSVLGARR